MSLQTPEKIRTLQRKLYRKAKADPVFRFYVLYDKICREDFLRHAYGLAARMRALREWTGSASLRSNQKARHRHQRGTARVQAGAVANLKALSTLSAASSLAKTLRWSTSPISLLVLT
jgi:hypothetical protein